ncbi:hypothetical protein M407DRAFT_243758 [Tulasnella calospora MUT 4182]|uniref:Glycosyltransferase family 1 protein n=1 Tax=Tulasnella calospora MUT 4182 TaxID=1051891 RepID=A0A0C3Q910_9AGAM|nr:hypothetical protein M407DRAFT_243758 [Tulasnella calospora MUT 4182]
MFYIRVLQIGFVVATIHNFPWFSPWFRFQRHIHSQSNTSTSDALQTKLSLAEQARSLHRRHIAIATTFKYHAEVYGPFAWTIAKIFANQTQPSSVYIYDEEATFVSMMKRLGQLPENILRSPEKERFIADVRSTSLFPDDLGAMIDLVFLVTCEIDLVQLGPELLQAWDERPRNRKFMLLCGVHNGADKFWAHENLTEWSKRGAFRLVTISDHVSNFFKTRLSEWADSKDPAERLSFYEYVNVNTFYPVSNFTDFPLPDKSGGPDVPCTAILQGGFEKKRRDYDRIFFDLVRLLREDPRGWGYWWSDIEQQYLPDANSPHPPFVLHLLGWNREILAIPWEIEKVVVKDMDFGTSEFHALVQSMDIVIPAFSPKGGYLTLQASSTIHTALENHVPILATRAMWEAYPHIRGMPSVLRPASLSEMEAIGLLRGARISSESPGVNFGLLRSHNPKGSENCIGPSEFCDDVQGMLRRGWKRTPEEWDTYLEGIWEKNERSIEHILRDM